MNGIIIITTFHNAIYQFLKLIQLYTYTLSIYIHSVTLSMKIHSVTLSMKIHSVNLHHYYAIWMSYFKRYIYIEVFRLIQVQSLDRASWVHTLWWENILFTMHYGYSHLWERGTYVELVQLCGSLEEISFSYFQANPESPQTHNITALQRDWNHNLWTVLTTLN